MKNKRKRKKMRCKQLLLFLTCYLASCFTSLSADTKPVTITIDRYNKAVREILKEIESVSDYVFFYNTNDVDHERRATVQIKDAPVEKVLEQLFAGTNNGYSIDGRQIFITKNEKPTQYQIKASNNSRRAVRGVVLDASDGFPLTGAGVVIKGRKMGVVTDENGEFSIEDCDEKTVLEISYVGYKKQEITIGNLINLEIKLEPDNELQEVIVVGYETQKKVSLTAAVGSVKGDELISTPVGNISNSLVGRMAGLVTTQNSGAVGKDNTIIRIRGISTDGNSNPLIVVDGIPRSLDFFNRLNSNSISSVNILKDAAAVAPYGMAGANGVVLITTKNGQLGKPQLSYNGYIGFSQPTVIAETLNAYEFALMYNEAMKNQNPTLTPLYSAEDIAGYKASVEGASNADHDKYPASNVRDYLYARDAPKSSHNITMSGGMENFNYYLGLGYIHQEGHWETVYMNRYTVDLSLEAKPTRTTTVGFKMNGINQKFHQPRIDEMTVNKRVYTYLPIHAITFTNGLPANSRNNNLDAMISDEAYSETDELDIFTQIYIEQELSFIKGLKFKGIGSFDPSVMFTKDWREPYPAYYTVNTSVTPYDYVATVDVTKPSLYENFDRYRNYTWQGILSYNAILGNHSIGVLAVYEGQKTFWNGVGVSRRNYEVKIDEISLGNPDQQYWGTSGSSRETAQLGYVGSINYGFKGKYLLSLAGRYDGSYYFAPGKKFGFFPSVALGWRVSEEPFIKKYSWINNLKIRGSWGVSGALAGSAYQYSSGMTVYGNSYVFNGSILQGAYERLEPNKNITWEKANKIDIGLDANLWKNRFGLEFDYFYEKRSNMLASPNVVVPIEYGIGLAQENAGVMDNRGFEFMLSSMNRLKNGLNLDFRFTMTYAKNKLIETFENAATRNDRNRSRTGRSRGTPFGYLAERLFQEYDFNPDGSLKEGIPDHTFSQVAPGDIKWVDVNKDGKIDGSDETALGYPVLPQIIYGFSSVLTYKNFDLEILFQGSAQSNIFLYKGMFAPFNNGDNPPRATLDYWTPENTDAKYPRPYGQGGNNNNNAGSTARYTSLAMRSGAYLRAKNITLGYTLPKTCTNVVRIESVRFYVSLHNFLTFSDVSGLLDPEMDYSGSQDNNMRGWYSPHQKTLAFGINIDF
jgi:TonB-linked SusC/RagA family outer membrane protein